MDMTEDEEDDFRIMVNLTDDQVERREAALEELLRKHGGIVKGTVRKQFGSQLAYGEEHEVLIRTAAKVWKYAHSFDDTKAKLTTWLVSIALREAIDLIAENQPDFDLVGEEVLDARFFESGSEEEPTKEDKKVVRDLNLVVSRLPKLQRAIIEADLACGDVADGERLAELHGTSKNSIYVSRNKAHATIEREMRKMGHYDPQQTGVST